MGNRVVNLTQVEGIHRRCLVHAVVKKSWRVFIGPIGPEPVQGFLKCTDRDCPIPEGTSPQMTTLADQEIADPYRVSLAFVRPYVDQRQILDVDLVPADIDISQVRDKVSACKLLCVHHFSETLVVAKSKA